MHICVKVSEKIFRLSASQRRCKKKEKQRVDLLGVVDSKLGCDLFHVAHTTRTSPLQQGHSKTPSFVTGP